MRKSYLRATAAFQALALLGAGATTAFIAATPAAAQDYTNVTASGRVIDSSGAPIAGATVSITSNGQGFTRTATTDAGGTYRVPQLPEGSYSFTIAAPGKDSFTDPAVQLSIGNSANEFQLGAAQVTNEAGNTVVVTGRRTRTSDFDRVTTGAVINVGELATRVPVARDITSVVLLSPGSSQGDAAFGNLPSIAGASVSENTYYINGLNITNFRNGLGSVTVPFDFYETVEVKNGGLAAEFGRTTGGFINATTKRGSNQFHAGVNFNWEPNGLRSESPNTFGTDNDSEYFDRKDVVGQVSGPIIKDRLFFYGLYNWREVHTEQGFTATATALNTTSTNPITIANNCFRNPTFCQAFEDLPEGANQVLVGSQYNIDRTHSPFYGVKFDAIPIDGHRLEFTLFDTTTETQRDIYGTSFYTLASGLRYNPNTNERGGYVTTTLLQAGGRNWVGRYTGQLTDYFSISGAYGRNRNRGNTLSSTPDRSSIIDQRSGNIQIGNPTANSSTARDLRIFYRADADLTVNLFGKHHFRAGYDREDLKNVSQTLANGNYQITLVNSGTAGDSRVSTPNTQYAIRRFFRNGGEFKTKGEAFYIQDSWSLFENRLQLNLGVRNDKFTNRNGEGEVFYKSGSNWAPRLGFSADPFGDQKTKVYGSFSRYFLPVATNTNVRLAGPELDYSNYLLLTGQNADGTPIYGAPIAITGGRFCPDLADPADNSGIASCTVNSDGTTPPFASLVSQNLKAQSRDEYILGVERRITPRIRVGVYGTMRKLNESLEDAYIDQGIRAYCQREFAAGDVRLENAGADGIDGNGDDNGCLDIFTGFHQYALLNPGSDVTVLADGIFGEGLAGGDTEARVITGLAEDLGLPKAKAKYKSLTFTVDRDFDGVWSLGGSYTLSSLKGNIEGGVRSDNGQTDSGLTTAFDLPGLTYGAYGFLPPHRKHNLKIYGSYAPFKWLTVGANVQVTSPRLYGCIGRAPTDADGGLAEQYGAAAFYCNVDDDGNVITSGAGINTNNSGALTPRGTVSKSDWLYLVNLDAGLKLPVESFDATLRVSVFNVLNRKATVDLSEVGTTSAGAPLSTYGLTNEYQAPRSVRVQLGVNF